MTYFALIKQYSPGDQLIGIEIFLNNERLLLRDHDRRFRLHKLNKKGSGFLSTGKAVKNNDDLIIVPLEDRLWNDDERRAEYRKLFN